MSADRQQAINYLRAPPDGPWRWAEEGAVIVWRDGSTIAFRGEIQQILESLAPTGLPSFGAIVFLLAACRGKIPTVDELVPSAKVGPGAGLLRVLYESEWEMIETALDRLRRVSQLPVELHTGIKARCTLVEAVFETATVEHHVAAAAVLRGMQAFLQEEDLCNRDLGAAGSCIRQIHAVSEGLKRHTAESLALRLRTGLDALPQAADLDLPTSERARKLIAELSRDREAGVMARAARELMAAIRLPRRLAEHDELAVGGVADITNRGPLDRLLLSELAHDDLTLAVRVALNEALYLRREPPRREPPGTLALLLDSGVRLWGLPRVLATSVALALVACDRQHCEVRAWRAAGRQLHPVDLLTHPGLLQHLAALEVDAHPGRAIPALAEATAADARNQSVLITHRDALDDPEFRRALSDTTGTPGFIATVDRAGRFELRAMPLGHRPPLCEADLDLAAIFAEPKVLPARRVDIEPGLPAIFGMRPFPFLLPVTGALDYWVEAEDGFTYAILDDRRLVQFRDARSGARELGSNLPAGKTQWMDWVEGTVHVVKAAAKQRPARLVSVPGQGEDVRVTDLFQGTDVKAIHRSGEVILVIRRTDVRAFSLHDGRMLGRRVLAYRWISGRYFRGNEQFYFVSWDGSEVQFQPLVIPAQFDGTGIVNVFDREGCEGPWFVQKSGLIFSSAGDHQDSLPLPSGYPSVDSCEASRDGHRVGWSAGEPTWVRIKDLRTGKVTASMNRSRPKWPELPPALPSRNVFRVIESLAVLSDGLALCGRRLRWRMLGLSSLGKLQIWKLPNVYCPPGPVTSFADALRPTRHGCTLQRAELPNGTKVFLDSRGLLHLKPGRPGLAEVSLVLSQNEVAGWTSDGFVCGPEFFFEGPRNSEPARVLERLLAALQP